MKKNLWVLTVLLLTLIVSLSGCNEFFGGPCSYTHYQGKATITSILLLENDSHITTNKWNERYEVLYRFQLNEGEIIKEDQMNLYDNIKNKELPFTLTNSWYPNKNYLEKYGIQEGAIFNCTLKLITKGTCSPIIIDFQEINESDYLE